MRTWRDGTTSVLQPLPDRIEAWTAGMNYRGWTAGLSTKRESISELPTLWRDSTPEELALLAPSIAAESNVKPCVEERYALPGSARMVVAAKTLSASSTDG